MDEDLASLVQVTPFLGVSAMAPAIAFYCDTLGFTLYVNGGGYAYVERDRVGIRLLELDRTSRNPPGCSHIYVDLRGVDVEFARIEPALANLPPERYGAPKDQPYGQREFWVRDPDGNLITYGEGIGANAAQWDYRNEP